MAWGECAIWLDPLLWVFEAERSEGSRKGLWLRFVLTKQRDECSGLVVVVEHLLIKTGRPRSSYKKPPVVFTGGSHRLFYMYMPALRRHGLEQPVTYLHTLAAVFGANAAVLVHVGMTLAFLGAYATSGTAGIDQIVPQSRLSGRLARQDLAGCLTNIGTIQVQANTAHQIGNHRLCQTGIGTGVTHLGTRRNGFHSAVQVAVF